MRVTGGELAGRRIAVPRSAAVRPTADRVRESLFARLGRGGALEGARVADLYAGSGALGIEALSRGAAHVVFVDRAAACVAQLRRNLETLGVAARAEVRRGDAVATLARLAAAGARFDLVLADPPYAGGEAERLLGALAGAGVLAADGSAVVEVSRRRVPPCPAGLRLDDTWRYGDTLVLRYRVGPADGAERDAEKDAPAGGEASAAAPGDRGERGGCAGSGRRARRPRSAPARQGPAGPEREREARSPCPSPAPAWRCFRPASTR